MTIRKPLSAYSEVVDDKRKWTPDWYSWLTQFQGDIENAIALQTDGSWQPELSFGGATTGIAYASRSGTFVRTGTMVNVTGAITLSSKGSATGEAEIGGLPFSVGNYGIGTLNYFSGMSTFSGAFIEPDGTSTKLKLYASGAAAVTALDNTNFTNSSMLIFSGMYPTGQAPEEEPIEAPPKPMGFLLMFQSETSGGSVIVVPPPDPMGMLLMFQS